MPIASIEALPSAADTGERLFTVADLAALPPDLPSGPVHYELDEGRLLSMTPPGDIHGSVELAIAAALYQQGQRQGYGKARCGEVGIVLRREPRASVVGADAAFIANASLPVRRSPEGYLETIPDLVAEVLSPSNTKRYTERKIRDYLRAGVKELWIADPRGKTITIYHSGDEPGRGRVLSEGDTLRLETIIPGFELAVAEVFAE